MIGGTDTALQHYAAHDLLLLDSADSFIAGVPFQPWVREALTLTKTVVVRRGMSSVNQIPVGVRGHSRSQRCAGFVSRENILAVSTPESIVRRKLWRTALRREQIPAIGHLEIIFEAWMELGISWGPTGSVAFELVTGMTSARLESDLDLRIIAAERLSTEFAQELLVVATSSEIRIDIQMETPNGAVALAEYASKSSTMLLKTEKGPMLVKDPWLEIVASRSLQ